MPSVTSAWWPPLSPPRPPRVPLLLKPRLTPSLPRHWLESHEASKSRCLQVASASENNVNGDAAGSLLRGAGARFRDGHFWMVVWTSFMWKWYSGPSQVTLVPGYPSSAGVPVRGLRLQVSTGAVPIWFFFVSSIANCFVSSIASCSLA